MNVKGLYTIIYVLEYIFGPSDENIEDGNDDKEDRFSHLKPSNRHEKDGAPGQSGRDGPPRHRDRNGPPRQMEREGHFQPRPPMSNRPQRPPPGPSEVVDLYRFSVILIIIIE